MALLRASGDEAAQQAALVGPQEFLVAEGGVRVLYAHSSLAFEALETRRGGGGTRLVPFQLDSARRAEEDEEESEAEGGHGSDSGVGQGLTPLLTGCRWRPPGVFAGFLNPEKRTAD